MQHPPTEAMLRQLRAAPGVLLVSLQRGYAIGALPGAGIIWKDYEPGAGALFRVVWPPGDQAASRPATTPQRAASTQPSKAAVR